MGGYFSTGGSVCSHLLTLVSRAQIFLPCKMEAISSYETSVHTRSTRRHIPEDGILQQDYSFHRRQALSDTFSKLYNLGIFLGRLGKFLLALVSTVILVSQSRRTFGLILLSHNAES
jgi:hypothetical protein